MMSLAQTSTFLGIILIGVGIALSFAGSFISNSRSRKSGGDWRLSPLSWIGNIVAAVGLAALLAGTL